MTTKSSSRRIRAGSQELPSRITVLVFTTLSRIFIFTPLLLCSVRKANRECTVPCSGGPGACLMVRESQCTASELYSDCTVQWLQLHRQQEPPESVCHELHLVGSDADTCWATRITWSSRPATQTDADTISTRWLWSCYKLQGDLSLSSLYMLWNTLCGQCWWLMTKLSAKLLGKCLNFNEECRRRVSSRTLNMWW